MPAQELEPLLLSKVEPLDTLEVFPSLSEEEHLRLLKIGGLLKQELPKAHGPYTKWGVVSALQSQEGIAIGHNYEHSETHFEHAEQNALTVLSALGRPAIEAVFVAGNGKGSMVKEKQICPCFMCYRTLRPYLLSTTNITVFTPGTFERAVVLSPQEYEDAYEPKPYSEVEALDRDDIVDELLSKTIISKEDAMLLADLRIAGLDNGIHFYLTGSASGRGWTSQAINKKFGINYRDLDVIAETIKSLDEVEAIVDVVASKNYGDFQKINEVRNVWRLNTTNQVGVYSSYGRARLELFVNSDLQRAFIRKDYLDNNLFHKLS